MNCHENHNIMSTTLVYVSLSYIQDFLFRFGPHLANPTLPSWCEWWAVGCELKAVLKGFPTVKCPYTDDTPRPWNEPIPEAPSSEGM